MTLDIYFDDAIVYDVQERITVRAGTTFKVIAGDYNNEVAFSSFDKVLATDQEGDTVEVEALEDGESELQFQGPDRTTVKFLKITVGDVSGPAVDLQPTPGVAEPK
jgi:hypothetical protein